MAYSAWRFQRTAPGVFKSLARTRYVAFCECKAPLEADAETGDVLIAEVMLEHRDRVPQRARITRFDRFLINPGGRRQKRHRHEAGTWWVRQSYDPKTLRTLSPTEKMNVRVAQGVLRERYMWEPTRADWEALEAAVNHRAKRLLLGSRALRRI